MDSHEHPPFRPDLPGSVTPDGPSPQATSPSAHVAHVDSWTELALDLLDGALPPDVAAPLQAHLDSCPSCRAALHEQRDMSLLLRNVPQAAVPAGLEQSVLASLSGSPGTTSASLPDAGEAPRVSKPTGRSVWERVRALAQPRVWLPAAALALVLGVAVTSYYQAGLGSDESLRAGQATTTRAGSAPQADGATAEADSTATKETGLSTTTTAAASATETTAASLEVAGSGSPDEPPSVRINALQGAGTADTPVVWATVRLTPEQRGSAALVIGALTDLQPIRSASGSDSLPAYVALISSADVDAFTAALGTSELQVFSLSDGADLLPPDISARLADGLTGLPRLHLAAEDTGAAYGWPATEPTADPPALTGQVIMAITLVGEDG